MYRNGFWPDSALEVVQGSGANAIRLNHATAAMFRRMREDYAEQTHRNLTLVNSYHGAAGYRSWATQLDMRARPGRYDVTPGIVSGLPSGHGDGDCMDFDEGLAWVKENGHKYGVTFPIDYDHNHGRYDGVTLAGETGTRIPDETPAPAPKPKLYYNRRKNMADLTFKLVDGRNKFGHGENATFTFIGALGEGWLETTGLPSADPISVYIGGYGPEGGNISPINLTYAELVKYAEACHAFDADLARYRAAAQ